MALLLILAAVAFYLVIGWVRAARRRKTRLPPTVGVSTLGEDFEEFVRQPRTALPSRAESGSVDLGDGAGFDLGIVGESHYMPQLRKVASRLKVAGTADFIATLRPEPTNPYDANAVTVFSDHGEKLGYLSREDAVRYRTALQMVTAQGAVATCRAKLFGGTPGKPNIGVWLDIAPPEALLSRLAVKESPDQPL